MASALTCGASNWWQTDRRFVATDHETTRQGSGGAARTLVAAPVDHLQVVLPLARRAGKLPLALEGAGSQRGGEALVEPGVVAPDAQHAAVQPDAIGPAHAARVEVLHDQPAAGLGGADDADHVGELLVVVVGPLDEEVAALQPLERDGARHEGVDLRVGRLCDPGADQRT